MTAYARYGGSAMTASQTPPKVFVRNATGLRKEAGVLDVFVYNTNNQHSGLGVAFLGLGIGAYAGGLLPLSALLATHGLGDAGRDSGRARERRRDSRRAGAVIHDR